MQAQGRYYEHSGATPVLGLGLVVGAGAGLSYGLGWVYGVAIYWIPFVYIAFLLPIALGFGLGTSIAFLGRLGKVRSPGFCALAGLAAGGLAEWIQWQVWLDQLVGPEPIAALGGTWAAVNAVAEQGAWSLFSWTPTGGALWTIWGLEGLVIVGGTSLVAMGGIAASPFCERCEVWLDKPETLAPFDFIHDVDPLKAAVDAGDLSALRAMERVRPGATRYAALDFHECAQCHQLRLVSVRNVERKQGDGKEDLDETEILQHLIVDPDTWDVLRKKDQD
jgi:hypothetical protein